MRCSGVLACEDASGIFHGVGVYSIYNYMATSLFSPFNDVLSLNTVMEVKTIDHLLSVSTLNGKY